MATNADYVICWRIESGNNILWSILFISVKTGLHYSSGYLDFLDMAETYGTKVIILLGWV